MISDFEIIQCFQNVDGTIFESEFSLKNIIRNKSCRLWFFFNKMIVYLWTRISKKLELSQSHRQLWELSHYPVFLSKSHSRTSFSSVTVYDCGSFDWIFLGEEGNLWSWRPKICDLHSIVVDIWNIGTIKILPKLFSKLEFSTKISWTALRHPIQTFFDEIDPVITDKNEKECEI